MSKEEIESLFKKYKVRIPKEKQGQSECYECKRNNKYSLTWTSFLYEYKENYYCFEHIVNILLQQENEKLKEQLEKKNKHQIFIDTQDMEERYAEGLYQDYLEEENKKHKSQQKEFISYLENEIDICDGFLDTVKSDLQEIPYGVISAGKTYITTRIKENETTHKVYEEILKKYKEIIGVSDEKKRI